MGDFLLTYLLFLLKGVTVLIILMILIAFSVSMGGKKSKSKIIFEYINKKKQDLEKSLLEQFAKLGTKASGKALKQYVKAYKSRNKLDKSIEKQKKRSYILSFNGDLHASEVKTFRDEVTAILQVASIDDEVVVKIESPGGAVPNYGLLASQLVRIKQAKVRLTVCVDKIAASGGYLAAVVADRILAAPFAYIGSIGVVVTLPNLHEFLQKKDVNMIELTAGKHKRSISMLGKCTEEGKKHTTAQLKAIHEQFKELVASYRPQVDIEKVATGDYWTAKNALAFGLVDDLTTSDTYITELVTTSDVWEVSTPKKKTVKQLFKESSQAIIDGVLEKLYSQSSGI